MSGITDMKKIIKRLADFNTFLFPLYIKLDFMKKIVEELTKESKCFKYSLTNFQPINWKTKRVYLYTYRYKWTFQTFLSNEIRASKTCYK